MTIMRSTRLFAVRAVQLAALLTLSAAAGLIQPNSSALLFKNETRASLTAKDVSLEALRAHAAGLAFALLPDEEAVLLSKPRPHAYPAGYCNMCQDRTACPGRTCDQGDCPQFRYAGSRAPRALTECVSNIQTPCDDRANTDCFPCALWQEVSSRCAPMGASPLGCVSRGDYTIMPSRETVTFNATVVLCTSAQWMLVPTRACTGVDSSDPLCTGSKAEYWWGAAFDEAVLYGIAPGPLAAHPPPPSTTLPVWDLDLPVAPNTPSWGVAINPANRRSQHQTHIRFAKWQPTAADFGAGAYSNILPAWLAIETFSVDVANPTRTGPASPVVVANTTQWPLIATVFVATGAKPDAGAAKVWATAATVAHGLDPARPYGIMIAPRWQAKLGPGGGPVVPGVTVSAVFDIGSGQILDETPNPNDCVGTCEVWNKLWWEGKGARPQPLLFKSWAQAARVDASAAVNDCDLPPVPAGYTTKEWHEKLGLSW